MPNSLFKIACIVGTRPEIIKMAPVIAALRKNPLLQVSIINTAQHRSLLDDMLSLFEITPDLDLNIMQHNQSLSALTGHLFLKLGKQLTAKNYQLILAQGDTTTTLVSAQVAFYHQIPFGHIEAGLRSHDLHNPFPEEMNRVFISKLASLHFAPTYIEKHILQKEDIDKNLIFVTGNTVIDSLYQVAAKDATIPIALPTNKRIILLTLHRRESFGRNAKHVFEAMLTLTKQFPDVHVVYPVHPNPNIHDLAYKMLDHHPSITLTEPLRYDILVSLLKRAYLVCTDSGGLQEEAPALGKPVLILRDVTERPLIVEMGVAKLVGTNKYNIVANASDLLTNEAHYQALQKHTSPYGDGHAAEKIATIIANQFLK